jgi:putative IMPACT (imprinted ancient) family translation regulator
MLQIENIVSDKGSRYSVSGMPVASRSDVANALKLLCSKKKYAKATHNTWAVIFSDGERVKNDDGESGAGQIMLDILQRQALFDHLIIVSRWYGGVRLGADRFRHVRTCTQRYISEHAA